MFLRATVDIAFVGLVPRSGCGGTQVRPDSSTPALLMSTAAGRKKSLTMK